MNVSSAVLQLATQLADRNARNAAATDLAALLGGTSMLVFVRDPEVSELLTAPGFPQTLPNRRAWREFLQQSINSGQYLGEVPVERADERVRAIGIAESSDVVFVVLGTNKATAATAEFRALLPLLAAAFYGEQQAAIASAQARLAEESALQADSLVGALQATHMQLHSANAQLRRQAREQELQRIQLEARTAQLTRLNEELSLAREAADRASRAKSEFLTTMSHELRTPLNAISGYVQLLQLGVHGQLSEPQLEALERIDRSQRHLLRLINEVLSLARIEAGGVTYDIVDMPMNEAVTDIATLLEPQLLAKRLTLTLKIPEEIISVRADREKFDQILLNLLSNAVKFTATGGVIVIVGRSGDSSETAFVAVEDSGCGIPPDKLKAIFDPFVQVKTGTTRTHEGTGLGLAISRDLAHGMGGVLSVESEPGVGSVFTLTLPLAEKAANASPPGMAPSAS